MFSTSGFFVDFEVIRGTWAVMWTNPLYSTIPQAMDGCGIQAAAALASALVIPTAAACSLTAAAFVRAITFVFDLWSAAALLLVVALVVDFWSAAALCDPGLLVFFFVLLPRICVVAAIVPGHVSLGDLGLRIIAAAVAAATACVGVLMVALSHEFLSGSFKTPNVVIRRQPAAAAFQATSIDGATRALATATLGPRFACKAQATPRVDVAWPENAYLLLCCSRSREHTIILSKLVVGSRCLSRGWLDTHW